MKLANFKISFQLTLIQRVIKVIDNSGISTGGGRFAKIGSPVQIVNVA